MPRALGRKAPRRGDAAVLRLDPARHLLPGLPPIPDALDLTAPWPTLYLGHNDTVGDCGVAGLANGLSTEARREGRVPAFASRPSLGDDIRNLYFAYTGGKDEGVVLLDFLHWVQLRPEGFFGEKIGEPIAIDPSDWEQVTTAMALGFGLYFGGEITTAAVEAMPGSFWRTDAGDQSLAGGHCMFACGYIKQGSYGQPNVALESWGEKFYATWAWWKAHVDEAYILVDLARPSSFFKLETLRADLVALRAGGVIAAAGGAS